MQKRELDSSGSGNSGFTAAVIVKYIAIIVVVVIIAYVVLRVLERVQGVL